MKHGTEIYVGMPVQVGNKAASNTGYGEPGWVGWLFTLYDPYRNKRLTVGEPTVGDGGQVISDYWTVGVRFAAGITASYSLGELEALEDTP